jgi:hypothetical protein
LQQVNNEASAATTAVVAATAAAVAAAAEAVMQPDVNERGKVADSASNHPLV